jgi:hypothetical protein
MIGRPGAGRRREVEGAGHHNEADNFSVGANLGVALFAANVALWRRSKSRSPPASGPTRD